MLRKFWIEPRQRESYKNHVTPMHAITVFIIALSILLFFIPVIVIVAVLGNVQLGPIHIDLTNRTTNVRRFIALAGIGSWLALYIPLASLASKAMVTKISKAAPENRQLHLHFGVIRIFHFRQTASSTDK